MNLRERSCTHKKKYFSDETASSAKFAAELRSPSLTFRVYRCQFCRARHLTSKEMTHEQQAQVQRAARKQAKETKP